MADRTDFSVVIPAHNAARTIGRQLAALGRQNWAGPWEVVVADNGSTDDTAARALDFVDTLPSLRVVDASDRRGASHARNVGARAARAPYLLFLDADDEASEGWLQAMADAAASAALIAGVTRARREGPGDAEAGLGRPSAWSRIAPSAGFLDAAASSNLGVRRDVWEAVGGFREDMAANEDTAFCWDVQLAGHDLVHVPDAVVSYSMRGSLRGLARQQFAWGVGAAQLYALFRDRGAPRPSVAGALLRWVALLVMAPAGIAIPRLRRDWVGRLARRAGRLHGSLRYRVLSL
nr:glycosyltransferase [Propionibacterium sp.]